jgi:hypothetical protein
MVEVALAAVILVPLALLTYTALYLLRLGMTAAELTDAARQRLAGCGVFLLAAVILAGFAAIGVGLACLMRVFK